MNLIMKQQCKKLWNVSDRCDKGCLGWGLFLSIFFFSYRRKEQKTCSDLKQKH